MFLIAHNIRSLHNVGSLFRSADAFGVERLYLTGYTGTPPRAEIAKTALGSEQRVPWKTHPEILRLISELQRDGYAVIGLETGADCQPINEWVKGPACRPPSEGGLRGVAMVVGNEVSGIEPEIREMLDACVEIPMPGTKRSLNVSVAAGIALFAWSIKESTMAHDNV